MLIDGSGHGVEAAGAADDATARPGVAPAGRTALRHRPIAPVDGAALQARPLQRIGDGGIAGRSAGLDQRHFEIRILAQPRRQHAAGGARANHDEIELRHPAPSPTGTIVLIFPAQSLGL
jgi:hypothetical protein